MKIFILKIILSLFTLMLVFINSLLYIEYIDKIENIRINYMNCKYWENKEIPNNLNESKKWKLITTIGECKIIQKKSFLEENINNSNTFDKNLNYSQISSRARVIGTQANFYLNEFKGK